METSCLLREPEQLVTSRLERKERIWLERPIGCDRCVLVEGYAGATFTLTASGRICNFCQNFKPQKFLGESALVKDISLAEHQQVGVTVSGGKDSANVWLWLVENFGADRVVAFNHKKVGLVHPVAEENLKNIGKQLGSKLVQVADYEFYPRFRSNLRAILSKPDPALVRVALCAGCRVGISGRIFQEAEKMGIDKIVNGASYLELAPFKSALMRIRGLGNETKGLLAALQENLLYYFPGNLMTIMTDAEHCHESDLSQGKGKRLYPAITYLDFYRYVPNTPAQIENKLVTKLNWQKPAVDDWHFDCLVGEFKNLLYYKLLGYTEVDYKLCEMVRYSLLTRKGALTKLHEARIRIMASADRLATFLRTAGSEDLGQRVKEFAESNLSRCSGAWVLSNGLLRGT